MGNRANIAPANLASAPFMIYPMTYTALIKTASHEIKHTIYGCNNPPIRINAVINGSYSTMF